MTETKTPETLRAETEQLAALKAEAERTFALTRNTRPGSPEWDAWHVAQQAYDNARPRWIRVQGSRAVESVTFTTQGGIALLDSKGRSIGCRIERWREQHVGLTTHGEFVRRARVQATRDGLPFGATRRALLNPSEDTIEKAVARAERRQRKQWLGENT